jgi:hypothetical protein
LSSVGIGLITIGSILFATGLVNALLILNKQRKLTIDIPNVENLLNKE